mmetsp:Transcript_8207/g.22280  ORF Transcript_8207/g.22280 Transcript_8207/m.22280 type:complete len:248 (-) Transcript_8207:231-974(-)|eukprot:CAMPEP_0198113910 /NCGR_PEP_ID=MMETSP1442-20131203/5455_1 /TAXON_ID= /ORGANISM="Craspedostauros australis, Strain CCMP3328" /LENGTH=247 /DNA_ID=CAMNT_0043771109 /DNA_START=79 /DNA_END=822 /DNA_ORIENTATION=+
MASDTPPAQPEQQQQQEPQDEGLSPEAIQFTNAFNAQRMTLAGFARCANQQELDVVRDGFYLGLARDLCPIEYDPVREQIVTDADVASSTKTKNAFETMIQSARKSPGWEAMVRAVLTKAAFVGSDLENIWQTLEQGRLRWLKAASLAHGIKMVLKEALEKDGKHTEGDVSDAMMVWIYAVALNMPGLEDAVKAWQGIVKMDRPDNPLSGYKPELWDPRKPEWRPLDIGVQEAAERGGSNLKDAWEA